MSEHQCADDATVKTHISSSSGSERGDDESRQQTGDDHTSSATNGGRPSCTSDDDENHKGEKGVEIEGSRDDTKRISTATSLDHGKEINNSKQLPPVEKKNKWVDFFAIIDFDLAIGQKISAMIPEDNDFTAQERQVLSHVAFPDSNPEGDHCYIYTFTFFRQKNNSTPAESSPPAGASKAINSGDEEDEGAMQGIAYYRTKKDPSCQRGYVQQGVVLLSSLHGYLAAHEQILRTIAVQFGRACGQSPDHVAPIISSPFSLAPRPWQTRTLFEEPISQVELLKRVWAELAEWPTPHPHVDYKVELLGEGIGFSTQPKASSVVRGTRSTATQKTVAATSSSASPIPPSKFLGWSTSTRPGEDEGKDIADDTLMEEEESVFVQLDDRVRIRMRNETPILHHETIPIHRVFSLSSSNLSSVASSSSSPASSPIGSHLDYVTKLWELLMANQPILVLSNTPSMCSAVSLALEALLSPLQFSGAVHPFFTVQDPLFRQYMKYGKGGAGCSSSSASTASGTGSGGGSNSTSKMVKSAGRLLTGISGKAKGMFWSSSTSSASSAPAGENGSFSSGGGVPTSSSSPTDLSKISHDEVNEILTATDRQLTGFPLDRSLILGCTNPVFTKSYDGWPNVLALSDPHTKDKNSTVGIVAENVPPAVCGSTGGSVHSTPTSTPLGSGSFPLQGGVSSAPGTPSMEPRSNSASPKATSLLPPAEVMQRASSTSGGSLPGSAFPPVSGGGGASSSAVWGRKEKFTTSYKAFSLNHKKQTENLHKLLASAPKTLSDSSLSSFSSSLQDDLLRKFVCSLTTQFLVPLQQCFQLIAGQTRPFQLCCPSAMDLFSPNSFTNYIRSGGAADLPAIFSKSKSAEAVALYTRFCQGRNFRTWLLLQRDAHILKQLEEFSTEVVEGYSETELVDCFFNLFRYCEKEMKTSDVDIVLLSASTSVLAELALCLQNDALREDFLSKLDRLKVKSR